MNVPDRERHKTILGCAQRAKTPRWLSLMNVVTALGFSPTNTHPSFTCLCKSFRMCSRPRFASTDWTACLYVKGKLLPLKATKAYNQVEIQFHAHLTSATDRRERSSSRLGHFTPEETPPVPTKMLDGLQSPSGSFGEQRIPCCFRKSFPFSLIVQPVS